MRIAYCERTKFVLVSWLAVVIMALNVCINYVCIYEIWRGGNIYNWFKNFFQEYINIWVHKYLWIL